MHLFVLDYVLAKEPSLVEVMFLDQLGWKGKGKSPKVYLVENIDIKNFRLMHSLEKLQKQKSERSLAGNFEVQGFHRSCQQ